MTQKVADGSKPRTGVRRTLRLGHHAVKKVFDER